MTTSLNQINWTRINSCVNGNPRYVCHFLELISNKESRDLDNKSGNSSAISDKYRFALNRAKDLGGRKFHNKQYGGGIVFSSYNLRVEEEQILVLTGLATEYRREPNAYELKQGYGATHYRTFLNKNVTNRKGELKKWFKGDDGLTYSLIK